jgi:hypothetical protein
MMILLMEKPGFYDSPPAFLRQQKPGFFGLKKKLVFNNCNQLSTGSKTRVSSMADTITNSA